MLSQRYMPSLNGRTYGFPCTALVECVGVTTQVDQLTHSASEDGSLRCASRTSRAPCVHPLLNPARVTRRFIQKLVSRVDLASTG
jgi:hypothetical protein